MHVREEAAETREAAWIKGSEGELSISVHNVKIIKSQSSLSNVAGMKAIPTGKFKSLLCRHENMCFSFRFWGLCQVPLLIYVKKKKM